METYIYLISNVYTQNARGVWEEKPTPRGVFAKVHSITRAEFFNGGRNGLNPSFMFTVFNADYNNEVIVEYEGNPYSVYRTFRQANSDYVELYVERQGGSNGKESTT